MGLSRTDCGRVNPCRTVQSAMMDEREAAKLTLIQALHEHAETVEAFATEATLMAEDAERDGNEGFANALHDLARHHRATAINYEAIVRAQAGEELPKNDDVA